MSTFVSYLGTEHFRTDTRRSLSIDWSNIGTPSSPTVAIYNEADFTTELSGTHFSGSASVSGTDVITPLIISLEDGNWYRLEVKATANGGIEEVYIRLYCSDEE